MGEFLFAVWEGGGNVAPTLGAVRRLVARGHRVRVLADDTARTEVEAAGALFRPWRSAPNRPDRRPETCYLQDWTAKDPGGELLALLDRVTIGPAAAHAADTLAELRRAPADAVVSSDLLFGPLIAAEAASVPAAVLAVNVSVMAPIPGMPPVGPGMAPPRTPAEHAMAAEAAAWFAARLNERLPVLNAARAGFGLAPLADAFDQPRRAAMTLLATSRAFDFDVPALPDGMRYVGPLLDEPDWARGWTAPWRDARPLVLVAMSTTFQDQVGVIQRLLDAAATLPVRVVATLGPALEGTALRVPCNAAVIARGSHDALMAEAALVVTHGGHGTVMRALSHGRPLLCIPMGRDQNDNAARVVTRGAGLRLDRDAPEEALRAAIATLLDDPRHAAAAAALGEAIAATDPKDALVEALEELAAREPCRCAA
ncbi:nucleotide disphospho-sugar-binding domain-containing protein [Falsiroseomonas sp. HW251]|uniref:nucleotide disphospho-sugar-binding domain-containing protein n=1 Tax=Falsiroseomonas sp. HW251 TaxID=3390998 RepID=UPI003D316E8D